jgi:hypothetical protein
VTPLLSNMVIVCTHPPLHFCKAGKSLSTQFASSRFNLALKAGALVFQSLTSDKKISEKAKVKEERLAAMATSL